MANPKLPTDTLLRELRAFGLALPGAHTKSPWPGHLDLAVKDKTFAYLSVEGEPFSIGCKLPHSSHAALLLPFAKPTGYGLGKSGWVTAEFARGETPPSGVLKEWIIESYRAQAPKKLVASLPAAESGAGPSPKRTTTTTPKQRPRAARASKLTPAVWKKLALALPEVTANSHFGQPDFRVRNKIFAGLSDDGEFGTLKLPPEVQSLLVQAKGEAFFPAAGAWGRSGWTRVRLERVESAEIKPLLLEAWSLVAPKRSVAAHAASSTTHAPKPSSAKKRATARGAKHKT